jgi:hypothetical protein
MNYQTGDLTDPHRLSDCSSSGTLSLEVYTPAALVEDGKLTFSLSFVRNDWSSLDIPNSTFSVAGMKPDDWNRVSVPLSDLTSGTDLKFVAMRIDAASVSPVLQAGFNVDNILIKQSAQSGASSSHVSSSRSALSSSSIKPSSSSLSSDDVISHSSSSLAYSSVASSSSSSSAALACTNNPGDVFYDEVCAPWRPVSAYEQNYADSTNAYEITDGNAGGGARFNIIQSVDAGRNQVLDIEYLAAPEFFSAVRIRVPESESNALDMSEYANGKIIFDLKVISHGSANAPLEFNLDCSWPCASTPKFIRADVLNEWKTYEFSVAEMIDRGLDIKRTSMGFMLLPTWAKQAGAHYQVDNIRWVKGDAPANPETMCYSNFFDTPWNAGVSGVGVSVVGLNEPIPQEAIMTLTQGVIPMVTTTPDWSLMNRVWIYMFSGEMSYQTGELLDPFTLSNCSSAGTLSLEVYTPAALVEDGGMTFTVHLVDRDWSIFDVSAQTFSVADLKPDAWNKISVPLSAVTYHPNLKYVALRIDSTLVSPALQAGFNVDNILIKQAAQ